LDDNAKIRQAFLDALAQGESGGDYRILCGGGHFTSFDTFPQWAGFQGPAGISHAAGKYQFEPATWREVAERLGLTDFTPGSQDAGAWDLARRVYAGHTGRSLEEDLALLDTSQVASALHSTWTSLSSDTFPQRFRRRLSELSGTPAPQPKPVVQPEVKPVPAPPVQTVNVIPASHINTMAAGGVAYAAVVILVWAFSLGNIVVPEMVQGAFAVLITAGGGWFLHTTQKGGDTDA
jgi:muramidase (phage lysozyme)